MNKSILQTEKTFQICGIFIAFLYIYAYDLMPLNQYPNWIYNGFLFNELLANGLNNVELVNNIPPNSLTTVSIGLLSFILEPLYAGKLFLLIATIVIFIGIAKFLKLYSDIYYLNYLIAFVFTFNYNYFHGQIHFLLASGLMFYFIYKVREQRNISALYLAFSLLIYLSHFIPYFLFNLYFLVYFLTKKDYSNLTKVILFNIPIAFIFLHYVITKDFGGGGIGAGFDLFTFLTNRLRTVYHYYSPIPTFGGIHDGYIIKSIFVKLNIYVVWCYIGIFLYYIFNFKKIKLKYNFYLTIIIIALYFLVFPFFVPVGDGEERLLLLIAILTLSEFLYRKALLRLFGILFLVIAILQTFYMNYASYGFNGKFSNAPQEEDMLIRPKAQRYKCMISPLCYELEGWYAIHYPFQYKMHYDAILEHDTSLPFYGTGILKKK